MTNIHSFSDFRFIRLRIKQNKYSNQGKNNSALPVRNKICFKVSGISHTTLKSFCFNFPFFGGKDASSVLLNYFCMDKKQHKRVQTHLLEELKKERAISFQPPLKFSLKLLTTTPTTNIFPALPFRNFHVFFFQFSAPMVFVKKCFNTL